MALEIEATYQNGVLKPEDPLPLKEQQRVRVSIQPSGTGARQAYGLVKWTGSLEDLDYLISDPD